MKKIILGVLVIVIVGVAVVKIATPKYPEPTEWYEYEVSSGETLLSIIENNVDIEYDPYYIVYLIQNYNGCSTNIKAGQTIYLPRF